MVMLVLAAAEGEGEGLHLRPASGALGAHVLAVLVEGDGRLTVHRRRLRAHQLGSRRDGEVAVGVRFSHIHQIGIHSSRIGIE